MQRIYAGADIACFSVTVLLWICKAHNTASVGTHNSLNIRSHLYSKQKQLLGRMRAAAALLLLAYFHPA
jgi:hypothetical protein